MTMRGALDLRGVLVSGGNGNERLVVLGGTCSAANRLAHLSALALARLLIMLLRLERFENAFTLQHTLEAP